MLKLPTRRFRQRGVVAIMAGLTAVTLFAFGGVVLDLGHLYIAKSELQNAADAAALAGAKELNHTAAGVTAAVQRAIATAGQHRYDFSKPVNITIANIRLASCPNAGNTNPFGRPGNRSPTCTFVPAASVTSNAQAAGLSFLEVDTGTQNLNTYLMRVAGAAYNTTSTAGYAVAGRYETLVTPIGVCAIDPKTKFTTYTHSNFKTELVELGFRRGVTYNLFKLNPLVSGTSDPYLINPVDAYPNTCDPNHSSANFTAPFICTGSSAVLGSGTGKVYTNTGMTASLDSSLNSRFGDYKSPSVCDSASAPPDINIKEYPCKGPGTDPVCPGAGGNSPIDWMEPGPPNLESVDILEDADPSLNHKPKYASPPKRPGEGRKLGVPAPYPSYGPLWSYNPPVRPDKTPFTPSDANGSDMYNLMNNTSQNYFKNIYPTTPGAGFPAGTPPAPYNQTNNSTYFKPGGAGSKRDRRVLNIVIIDCEVPAVGPNSCAAMDVVGIGRFFMQVKADFTGGPNRHLNAEFAGLIDPVPPSDIRLYR